MKKNNTKIFIGLAICCFCVVIMSVGGYFAFNSSSPTQPTATPTTTAPTTTAPTTTAPTTTAPTTTAVPVAGGSGDSTSVVPSSLPVQSAADKLSAAFLKGGSGKFNKHMPGYCKNWKKGDQNKGDINYGKQTIPECQALCLNKGTSGTDELNACEWGKGDVTSEIARADCVGHTADINRYAASGHGDRMCWTEAPPEDYDGVSNEKLYGKK